MPVIELMHMIQLSHCSVTGCKWLRHAHSMGILLLWLLLQHHNNYCSVLCVALRCVLHCAVCCTAPCVTPRCVLHRAVWYTALCVAPRCVLHRAVCCTALCVAPCCVLHRTVMWFRLRISEKCFTHTSQLNCLPFSFLLCSPSSLSSPSFILPSPSSLLFLLSFSLSLPPTLSLLHSEYSCERN